MHHPEGGEVSGTTEKNIHTFHASRKNLGLTCVASRQDFAAENNELVSQDTFGRKVSQWTAQR